MNALPRQKLRELVSRHGPALCTDATRLEGLLRACCPPDTKREVDFLVSALKSRVAVDLRDASPSVPIEKTVAKLAKRFEVEQKVAPEAARWAVESWAVAMRKVSEANLSGGSKQQPVRLPAGAAKISDADLLPAGESAGGAQPGASVGAQQAGPGEPPAAGKAQENPASVPSRAPAEGASVPAAKPGQAAADSGSTQPEGTARVQEKPGEGAGRTQAAPAAHPAKPPASRVPAPAKPGPPAKKAVLVSSAHPADAKPGAFAPAPAHAVEAPLVHPAPSPLAPRRSTPRRGALGLLILVVVGLVAAAAAWRFFFLENRRAAETWESKLGKGRRKRRRVNPDADAASD